MWVQSLGLLSWYYHGYFRWHSCCLLVVVSQSVWQRVDWDVPGPWFNIDTGAYQYRQSHCWDKPVVRCLISSMGFPVPVRQHIPIESGPMQDISELIRCSTAFMPHSAIGNRINCCNETPLSYAMCDHGHLHPHLKNLTLDPAQMA